MITEPFTSAFLQQPVGEGMVVGYYKGDAR